MIVLLWLSAQFLKYSMTGPPSSIPDVAKNDAWFAFDYALADARVLNDCEVVALERVDFFMQNAVANFSA